MATDAITEPDDAGMACNITSTAVTISVPMLANNKRASRRGGAQKSCAIIITNDAASKNNSGVARLILNAETLICAGVMISSIQFAKRDMLD